MIQMKKREFEKIVNKLKKKFCLKEGHTGDWKVKVYYKGNFVAWTKCSEGRGDLPPIIAKEIKKQLHFANDREFLDFKDCTMTCKKYLNLLKARRVPGVFSKK